MIPLTTDVILRLLFGCIILLAGRNVFWLFIGLLGFLFGAEFAATWLTGQPAWMAPVVAIGAGLIGALLAVVFERVAFAVAGFYAAAFLAMGAAAELGFAEIHPAAAFAAGVAGAILAALLTDWAIIVLSALAGAAAVVSALTISAAVKGPTFLVLAAIGILVQYGFLARRRHA